MGNSGALTKRPIEQLLCGNQPNRVFWAYDHFSERDTMSEPTCTHPPDPNQATVTRAPDAGAAGREHEVFSPPGYELLGEIGSGGMGVIYRARDLDLGREVAVKILLSQYAPDSATARRFVDEARITGRLQHPGIPAIYRVGSLENGRPFLAMKLIGGRTLEEMLKPGNTPPTEKDQSPTSLEQVAHGMFDRLDAALQRGRLLAVFEQVAQAVGYAHQQGVIHRDLKPSNVMVGNFGEVQVLDWGIARSGERISPTSPCGANGEPTATIEYAPHDPAHTPQSDLTQAGAILGTPAYMPPEQAIGAIDQIGKHSDVFGLGAILCVILTGKPPYLGADAESNRQLAARAKLEDAFSRLDTCGAETELVALAKRCLAPEPKDRPRDAGAVAEAVERLRAESERRAREAEMDRARAQVKTTEERKRRRVQLALVLSIFGLLAVVAYTARYIDNEATARNRREELEKEKREREAKEEESKLKARQLATEQDVLAALNEVQILREQGWKQTDDPAHWELSIAAARPALKRALRLGVGDDPRGVYTSRLIAAQSGLAQDERDRALLAELDRIADSNEIRLLMPVSITTVTARQFATAFRTHGIDLLTVPTEEAVAWLKGHRLRNRLAIAIRIWQQSYPPWDPASVADIHLTQAVVASTAVAGNPAVEALIHGPGRQMEKLTRKTGPHARLNAILDGVTEDPFAREWWGAVDRKDTEAIKKLIARPEIGRLTARELGSLAEGMNPMSPTYEALGPFLQMAYERFPGEFWVHFRMASQMHLGGAVKAVDKDDLAKAVEAAKKDRHEAAYRHLTAALAIRPTSAIARVALGMELIENGKNETAGFRFLHSAAEVDPTSPWPQLLIGMWAIETGDWPEAFQALKQCIRIDPDTGYFMLSSTAMFMLSTSGDRTPPPAELEQFFNDLIAIHPDHPGGYDLLGQYHYQVGNYREALGAFEKSKPLLSSDHPPRGLVAAYVEDLKAMARWEEKFPAVLRGEIKPADSEEFAELAGYCAMFEKKYALATRMIIEASAADPTLLTDWMKTPKFAGWAIQAATGNGLDASTTPLVVREQYRRLALEWIRNLLKTIEMGGTLMRLELNTNRHFAPVRDLQALAKLPPAERALWEKLWAELAPLRMVRPQPQKRETAPLPRAKE